MTVRRMSAREARTNFSELLGSVYYTKEPVLVEKKGKPYAVVISPEQYALFARELDRALATIEQVRQRNTDKDPDDVLRDVTAVVEEVRQERYEREQQAKAPARRR